MSNYSKEYIPSIFTTDSPVYSLACCPTAVPCVEQPKPAFSEVKAYYEGCCKKKKEKESTMGYNSANANLVVQAAPANPDMESKNYLSRRVSDVYREKYYALSGAYHLDEDFPQTGQTMIDRILQGKYILKPKTSDEYDNSRIVWQDPATPPDRKGYDAAVERLSAAKQKASDEITVLFPEMGLESLREFEKFDATVEAAPTVH